MENSIQVLKPYELNYSDLISLSSSPSNSSSQNQRLELIPIQIIKALGPTGPGLFTVTGLPYNVMEHRNSLLPLARDLSLLPQDHRKLILKDHGLGSDVPLKNLDRCVSSFAMQLKYGHDSDLNNLSCVNSEGLNKNKSLGVERFVADERDESMIDHFKHLGCNFRELGMFMTDLGLRVARVCDKAIGGNELENSLTESGMAKGRLIHYHSSIDTSILKEAGKRNGSKRRPQKSDPKSLHRAHDDELVCEKSSNLWQQWHYDYGTFTILTSPMFIKSKGRENLVGLDCSSPSENTYLQIFHPNKKKICTINAPPDSFIVQVGESADILSKKKLRATLHSVSLPEELEYLSRETFVVFLHPAWNKVFDISEYPMEELGERSDGDEECEKLTQEIEKIIPPLSARLKNGMTFADFSRETTKQYYGGNGLQSNR